MRICFPLPTIVCWIQPNLKSNKVVPHNSRPNQLLFIKLAPICSKGQCNSICTILVLDYFTSSRIRKNVLKLFLAKYWSRVLIIIIHFYVSSIISLNFIRQYKLAFCERIYYNISRKKIYSKLDHRSQSFLWCFSLHIM